MKDQQETAYISPNAYDEIKEFISQNGYNIIEVQYSDSVSAPVNTHPDIFMCKIEFPNSNNNSTFFYGDVKNLGNKYPDEAIYNACATGQYFVHNLKFSDRKIRNWAEQNKLEFVDAPQGYTRCNLLPVGPSNFITSDRGIFRALSNEGADVLLISNKNIVLEGYDYGFLAGCAGIISTSKNFEHLPSFYGSSHIKSADHTVVFNGDLSAHPDFEEIIDYINNCGLNVLWVRDKNLSDIGSILCTEPDSSHGSFEISADKINV